MVKKVCILLFLLSVCSAAFSEYQFLCTVNAKQVCSNQGCKAINPEEDDYRVIDLNENTYRIGDVTHEIYEQKLSGIFQIVNITPTAYIKINLGLVEEEFSGYKKGEFFEARDQMLASYQSWGTCRW